MSESRRWGRVHDCEVLYGLKKRTLFRLLQAGQVKAKKVNGLLFVDLHTVETLIDEAPDWKPTERRSA